MVDWLTDWLNDWLIDEFIKWYMLLPVVVCTHKFFWWPQKYRKTAWIKYMNFLHRHHYILLLLFCKYHWVSCNIYNQNRTIRRKVMKCISWTEILIMNQDNVFPSKLNKYIENVFIKKLIWMMWVKRKNGEFCCEIKSADLGHCIIFIVSNWIHSVNLFKNACMCAYISTLFIKNHAF